MTTTMVIMVVLAIASLGLSVYYYIMAAECTKRSSLEHFETYNKNAEMFCIIFLVILFAGDIIRLSYAPIP